MIKRALAALFGAALCLCFAPAAGALESAPPAVTAQAYAVMDADTGQILVQQKDSETHFPASITKIMTMALAMEHCGGDLTGQVTVSASAVAAVEEGSSYVALQPGEVTTLADIFNATMLMSANDGANVLAEYTAGSMEAFVQLMNRKAAELGMTGTHFANPSGWHNDDHYTTAADMARLTRWALTVPGFKQLLGADAYTMQPTNKQPEKRPFGTDNVMLVQSKMTYDGTVGGKSGWTKEAGYTLVEVAQRAGRTLIGVVLQCPQKYDKFKDCIALFDYCFNNFAPVALDTQALAPPSVPVLYNGRPAGSVPLEASASFLLHKAYTAADVQATYSVPESYVPGTPFAASVTLALREAGSAMEPQIASFPVSVNPGALAELVNTAAAQTTAGAKRPWYQRLLGAVLFAVGLLAAALAARIVYVARVREKRRRERAARRAAQERAHKRALARAQVQGLRVVPGGTPRTQMQPPPAPRRPAPGNGPRAQTPPPRAGQNPASGSAAGGCAQGGKRL